MSTVAAFFHTIGANAAAKTRIPETVARFDTTRTRVVLLLSLVLGSALYLWLVNSTTTAGLMVSQLERDVYTLEDEYQRLELRRTELTSLEHLEERSGSLELVAGGTAEYATGSSAVAVVQE